MKHYDTMTGYKATNANMQCRGFQYELGKWHKHEGEVKLCEYGFHFCVHPSGPWNYYSDVGTRIFKIEARDVLVDYEAGAELKAVCREIMFVEEVKIGGDRNTGNWNTGNWNTGNRNTGNRNTGDRNTGNWNTTNRSCGLFCAAEPNVIVFDVQADMTMDALLREHPECRTLGDKLMCDNLFDYAAFATIPGWTLEKCKALHEKFIEARKGVAT